MFLVTQTRVTNIPLFFVFRLQLRFISASRLSLPDLTIASLLFQRLSFFAFGGSNAISSIDLSNAYNGISGYNVVAVGLLTFCGNWAGPLWWTSGTVVLLTQGANETLYSRWVEHLSLLTSFVSTSIMCVMLACTVLRTHLFVWTVFSPKYLYSMAWTIGHHLAANAGIASLLLWIAC